MVETLRTTFYESVAAPQADLDMWAIYYYTERPHQGYCNMGCRPNDTVNLFTKCASAGA